MPLHYAGSLLSGGRLKVPRNFPSVTILMREAVEFNLQSRVLVSRGLSYLVLVTLLHQPQPSLPDTRQRLPATTHRTEPGPRAAIMVQMTSCKAASTDI